MLLSLNEQPLETEIIQEDEFVRITLHLCLEGRSVHRKSFLVSFSDLWAAVGKRPVEIWDSLGVPPEAWDSVWVEYPSGHWEQLRRTGPGTPPGKAMDVALAVSPTFMGGARPVDHGMPVVEMIFLREGAVL